MDKSGSCDASRRNVLKRTGCAVGGSMALLAGIPAMPMEFQNRQSSTRDESPLAWRGYFDGLPYAATDRAIPLALRNELVLLNLTSQGRVGVGLELGQVKGYHAIWDLPSPRLSGLSYLGRSTGQVDGVPDQQIARTIWTDGPTGRTTTPDFSGVGSQTFTLMIFNKGEIVFQRDAMSGPAFENDVLARADPCYHTNPVGCSGNTAVTTRFTIPDGTEIEGDFFMMLADRPTKNAEFMSTMTIEGNSVSRMSIVEQLIILFGVPQGAIGQARLQATTNAGSEQMLVSNIGDNGDDGMEFDFLSFLLDFNRVAGHRIDLAPIATKTNSAGDHSFKVGAIGQVEGRKGQNLGNLRIATNGSDRLTFVPEFLPLGSDTFSIEILDAGRTIIRLDDRSDVAASISNGSLWPTAYQTRRDEFGNISFTAFWSFAIEFDIPDVGRFAGNELRILSRSSIAIDWLDKVSLQVAGIDTLTIVNEKLEFA